jgi:hypothetical protein
VVSELNTQLDSPIVTMVQSAESLMRKDAARGHGVTSAIWRSLPE